jgi:hypothetical protein
VRTFQSAINVGAKLLNAMRNGEIMESFSANSAKSYIGKNVNLHLKDGAVIVNVHLTKLHKCAGKNNNLIEYISHGNRRAIKLPLKNVAWAEMLTLISCKELLNRPDRSSSI